jgi:O-antigen/teichoic acid export membrane protein
MIVVRETRHDTYGLSTLPEEERYRDDVSRVARGAGITSFGQGASRVLSYASQVALARMYGAAQLGLYVLGTTLVVMANVLAQIGMDNGVVRYVAHYRVEKDVARMRGIILLALWISFGLSLVLAGLMFFSAGFLADKVYNKPSLEILIRVFSVSLPFFTLMSMTLWALQGFQNVRYPTYVRQILQPLVNLVLVVLFYLLGAQVIGAAAAYALSMVGGSVLALYYLKRVFPRFLDRAVPAKFETRALLEASGPMIVANVTNQIYPWTTVTVLGIFAGAETVGLYQVAARTAAFSQLALIAFVSIFTPMASRLMVFGKEFVSGWPAMVMIAGAYLFGSSVGLTGRILAMTGHQTMVMLATLGAGAAGIVCAFALVPRYGLLGAAVATAGAIVLSNGTTLFSVRKLFGFWPYNRGYLKSVAAGVCATIVAYLGKLVLPLSPGILTILVLAPLFVVVFAALLFVMGLSPSDRQFLAPFLAKIRRSTRRDTRAAPE